MHFIKIGAPILKSEGTRSVKGKTMKPIKLNCSITFTLCGVLMLAQNIDAMQVKYEYDDMVVSVQL